MDAMDIQINATFEAVNTPSATERRHAGTHDLANIVDFDGVDDPQDPLNWPSQYKWYLVLLISLLSLVV